MARSFFRSFRARLILLIVLAVIPASMLILYTAAQQRQRFITDAYKDARTVTRLSAANYTQLILNAHQLLVALAQTPVVRDDDPSACMPILAAIAGQYPAYAGMVVIEADGDWWCGSTVPEQPTNYADRSWYQQVVQTKAFTVGDYTFGRTTQVPILPMAYPVLDDEDHLQRIVSVALSLAWFDQIASELDLPANSAFMVIDPTGTILSRYPEPERWVGQSLPDAPIIRTILAQETGINTADTLGLDRVPRVYAYQPVRASASGEGIYLVTGIAKSEALAPANQILVNYFIALGLIVALALAVTWFGGDRFFIRPTQTLVRTAMRLRAGDLGARVGLASGPDELRQLAQAFDEMAGALQQREHELRQLNEDLEQRVVQRTAELTEVNAQLQIELAERKRIEQQLRMWAHIFEHAEWGVVVGSADGKTLQMMNPAFANMHGYTVDELTGRPIVDVFAPDSRSELPEQIRIAHEKGHYTFESRHIRKDGSTFPVIVDVTAVKDREGDLLYRVVNVQDITERKRAEQALRESEERFRLVFERSTIGKSLTAPNGRLLQVNQAFADMLGYTVEEMQQLDFAQITLPEDVAESQECVRCLLANERTGYRMEKRYIHKNERVVWADVSTSLLRDESGRPLYFITSIVDITERKQAEDTLVRLTQELARSNSELEQFAYVASHDLQEPLRVVTSYLQLLERRYQGQLDEDATGFITRAVGASARMKTLINDLLAYSRVTTRGKPFKPVNCNEVLDQVLGNLKTAIDENEAVITHDPLPTVTVDMSQMIQLLQNLIGNAIKFHGEDIPRVHIGVEHQDGEWLFSVRDNGIGIEPEYAERIFVIFQRLHTRQEYAGTGIGLAICKKIIERHGGRIWVQSQPGQGSVFYFTIPDQRMKMP